jgi:AcrR family transcriptional regulator
MAGRRSNSDARETRLAILRRAADIGSAEGLGGITIGRLAADLGMSKAGVVGQFGSKEALQLATIEHATQVWTESVWAPVADEPEGMPRLLAALRSWVDYMSDPPFAGGCFLALTSLEYGAQEGTVHDALAASARRWGRTLLRDIRLAVAAGDLPPDTDPDQLVFVLDALAIGVKRSREMRGDPEAASRCLRAMHAVLGVGAAATGHSART